MQSEINQITHTLLRGKYLSKLLEVKNIIDTFVNLKIKIRVSIMVNIANRAAKIPSMNAISIVIPINTNGIIRKC